MSVSSLSVSVGGEWCCYWLYVAAAETTLRGRKVVLRIAETRDHTKATAEGTFWLAETTARNTLRLTLAAADTNLWTAQENARVTAHQSLHSDLALPWTGYLVAAAVARRDWWTGFHATYVGLAVDRNSAGRVPAPGSGLALGVVVGQVCGCLGACAGVRPCARCCRGAGLRVPAPGSGLALGVVVGQVWESETVLRPGQLTDRQSRWLAFCKSLTGTDGVSNLVHRAEQQSTGSAIWRKRTREIEAVFST